MRINSTLYARISPVAQRPEATVAKCSLTSCVWACFWIGSYTMPRQQHSQPTPTSLGQGSMCVSGVTCHLHFLHNDWGLLRATVVTRGWNGRRIKVSTQSRHWRRKFSRRSCRDSNSQPFDHESRALTNKLSQLHTGKIIIWINHQIEQYVGIYLESWRFLPPLTTHLA